MLTRNSLLILLAFNLLWAPLALRAQAITPGAERMSVYLPLLKGKRIGVYANPTSMVGNTHLVDTLLHSGVNVKLIFGPEHGFRGTADAGEDLSNYVDKRTGIQVVSLYGPKSAPDSTDLKAIDIIVFDIQDVGVHFYTFISSLQRCMEAAFAAGKPMMILDRPNPNGFYVDGPVLEPKYKSFVGLQPVPINYGMTIGEYAMMIAGERWLTSAANARHDYYRYAQNSKDTAFHFLVIKCANYDHKSRYKLPVKPSPNLPDMASVWLYPSTCLFEGTILSEGRGTERPFQIFGHPDLPKNLYAFTPISRPGAKDPKLKDQLCYGWDLGGSDEKVLKEVDGRIQLRWLIEAYKMFPNKDAFFPQPKSGKYEDMWLHKLVGNDVLMKQIRDGVSEEEIRKSWQPGLQAFKAIRKKYLLYQDFE